MATSHSTPHGETCAIPTAITIPPLQRYAKCAELRRWLDNEGEMAADVVRVAVWDALGDRQQEIAEAEDLGLEAILSRVLVLRDLFENYADGLDCVAERAFASVIEGLNQAIGQGRAAQ